MRFRQDINALRGVAVTLVMLFHFHTPWFGGGFLGVDVFFVISGYLMTAIIVGKLEQQRFSLWDFYVARFTRIVPALAVLAAALLLFGWFYLDPHKYKILAEHAGAALTFISNIIYWREAGYFDVSSQSKWLLHSWSLGVEWQFYMLYPIALMLGTRLFGRKRATYQWLLIAIGVASFALDPIIARNHPEANFFLLPTRAWEMVCGGLVLLNAERIKLSPNNANWLQGAGLAAILLAALTFTPAFDWPGPMTLVPVLGAVLVILADANDSAFSRTLPLQLLGRWSYSIYLWHWPLTVLISYLGLPAHQPVVVVGGIALSVVLGLLSYELVERRASALRQRFKLRGLGALAAVPLTVFAACTAITFANGAAARLPEQVRLVSAESTDIDPRRTECLTDSVLRLYDGSGDIGCKYGSSPVGIIVWGDSHGNAVISSVAAAAARNHASAMFYGTSGCPPLLGASRFGKYTEQPCRFFAKRVAQEIGQFAPTVPVLIVARFSAYVDGKNINNTDQTILIGYHGQRPLTDPVQRRSRYAQFLTDDLCALAKKRPVYVLLPIPEMTHDVPNYLAKSLILGKPTEDVSISETAYFQRNDLARAAIERAAVNCGVKTLDPVPYLCHDGRCFGSEALIPFYIDGDHLSLRGGKQLTPLFRSIFDAS